jgi:hypothetical protein
MSWLGNGRADVGNRGWKDSWKREKGARIDGMRGGEERARAMGRILEEERGEHKRIRQGEWPRAVGSVECDKDKGGEEGMIGIWFEAESRAVGFAEMDERRKGLAQGRREGVASGGSDWRELVRRRVIESDTLDGDGWRKREWGWWIDEDERQLVRSVEVVAAAVEDARGWVRSIALKVDEGQRIAVGEEDRLLGDLTKSASAAGHDGEERDAAGSVELGTEASSARRPFSIEREPLRYSTAEAKEGEGRIAKERTRRCWRKMGEAEDERCCTRGNEE